MARKANKRISVILTTAIMFNCCIAASAAPFIRMNDGAVYSWHANSSSKIAITFDDGPHPKYTREILEILNKYNVPATFFVIGSNADLYPELVKAEIDAGHEIGNHTYTHANLRRERRSDIVEELEATERAIYEADEYRTKLLRPPEGKYTDALEQIADENDYSIILWTVDTRDWAHTKVEKICDNVLGSVKSGDIILFHDHITGGSPTPEALDKIIPELKSRGFKFVTVSELLGSE